jgi:hypothetical protein
MDEILNPELYIQQLDYVDSFNEPAEFDFLTDEQKNSLDAESKKLDKSIQHFKVKFGVSNWSEQMDKEMVQGDIYTIQQALTIADKFKALRWYGSRWNMDKSLVTPTGQRIIMSKKCSDELELGMDSYISKDSLDPLLKILSDEGVDSASIEKVKIAAAKYGVVVLQNGSFVALKPLLEDYLSRNSAVGKSGFSVAPPVPRAPTRPPVPTVPKPVQEPEITSFQKRLAQAGTESFHGGDLEALKHKLEASKPKETPKSAFKVDMDEVKREVKTPELPAHQETPKPIAPKPIIAKPIAPKPLPPVKPILPPKPIISPKPVIQQPKPQPVKPQSTPEEVAALGKPLTEINNMDDLKRISVQHLRQGPVRSQLELIRSKILEIARDHKVLPFYAVVEFEQSPLFKAYLNSGSAIVSGQKAELTQEEFEAVADLKKKIENL